MNKDLKNMIKYNFKSLLEFELIYKLLTSIIFVPIFLMLFNLITKLRGFEYLTFENIVPFLLNPISFIFIVLLILFMSFYTIIDIGTVIIILDSSYQKKKIKLKDAFLLSCKKTKELFKPKNMLLSFIIIFLIPFLNLGISSGFISSISIPEFILDFIKNNNTLLILYIGVVVLLLILFLRWMYVIHYFILENDDFKNARKKSINLSKKNRLKDLLAIFITQLIIFAIYVLFMVIGIFIILLIYKLLGKTNIFGALSITIIWMFLAISFIIVVLLSTPISYGIISMLFYKHKNKIKEKIIHSNINEKEKTKLNKRFKIALGLTCILLLISGCSFTYLAINNKLKLKIDYVRTMEVTAHRGASIMYPENTMSAFVGAKELGSDWIELDVQQTKDGKIIVLHDTNLKRTTGVNKETWQLNYDEIKDLDAGSFFDKKYSNERIPLLEDVIKYAKENFIKLNIELKPSGNEKDFESSVVDIINKNNFASNCVVTSQVYEVLENVKKYDSKIKTVYVMSLAYGDITKLDYADSFSIEASSITKTLVNKIHDNGKEIYGWTVNTKENISKMINLNVDNIITDNISLAKETIYESKTSNVVNEYVNIIEKILN